LVLLTRRPVLSGEAVPAGGTFVSANIKTFPALALSPIAMTFGTIAPCGIVPVNIHPRADELVIVVSGTILVQFIAETGTELITSNVTKGQMILIPQGALHAEINDQCEEATFVGTYNHNDPGNSRVAANLIQFHNDILFGSLGVPGAAETQQQVQNLDIVRNIISAGNFTSLECRRRCGLDKH